MPDIALTPTNASDLSTPASQQPVVPEVRANSPAPVMQPDTMTAGATKGVLEQYRDLGLGAPTAASSDMMLTGAPVARREGHVIELTTYQQSGTVLVDGDTVTQQLGRGKTAEYSLRQLAAHSKDPEYFENTMRYAAKHGDSVRIDVHRDVARVTDSALEQRLPQNTPLRDPILHAAVKHDVDPAVLAAIGTQETHLGANYLGNSTPDYNMTTHRGDREPDSSGGHGYGPFQKDDGKRFGNPGLPQAELDHIARDPYYAANVAAVDFAQNLKDANGNVRVALHLYNAGSLSQTSTTTDWGPRQRNVPYEDSALRYLHEIQDVAARESQSLGLRR